MVKCEICGVEIAKGKEKRQDVGYIHTINKKDIQAYDRHTFCERCVNIPARFLVVAIASRRGHKTLTKLDNQDYQGIKPNSCDEGYFSRNRIREISEEVERERETDMMIDEE